MTQEDPPRLFDLEGGTDASSELGRALRSARADVLSPDAIARVRVGVAAKAAAASPIASTAATATKGSSFGLLAKAGLALVVVGAGLGIYGLSHREIAPLDAHKESSPVPAFSSASQAPAPTADLAIPEPPASAPPAKSAVPRAPTRPAPQPSVDAVAREGAILLSARRILDSDPERALGLVKKCEADFPDSQLAPERARIAAQARSRLSGSVK